MPPSKADLDIRYETQQVAYDLKIDSKELRREIASNIMAPSFAMAPLLSSARELQWQCIGAGVLASKGAPHEADYSLA